MIISLPGITGSGPDHWQSRWEALDSRLVRFAPTSWDHPDLTDWQRALSKAVASARMPPVLIAHSLACLLVVHWAMSEGALPVAGAFLVSVPDGSALAFPEEAGSFRNPPSSRLPFPTVILVSADDPFGTPEHAERRALEWGAGLVKLGPMGHINAKSELGDWEEGRLLLTSFLAGIRF